MPDKKEKPAELTWAQERAEEKRAENFRTGSAIATVVAAFGILLILIGCSEGNASAPDPGFREALLAALVATAVVAGARALEGPDRNPQRRKRNALPPASQMARSWLSCFIAIAAVILLTQLIKRIDLVSQVPPEAQSGMTVSGTLTVETNGKSKSVEIAGQAED